MKTPLRRAQLAERMRDVFAGGVRRAGRSSINALAALVFALFFTLILVAYVFTSALSAYASASTAGWFSNMTGIWGVMGVVILAVLLYGIFRHGITDR